MNFSKWSGRPSRALLGAALWLAVLVGAALPARAAAAAGELVVGQVASMSGPNGSALGLGMRAGMEAYFAGVNAAGGIRGQKVRLVVRDDRYQPAETVRLAEELIRTEHPVAFASFRGTANTLAVVQSGLLERAQVPLVGALTGAKEVQGAPWIFHTRTSYAVEAGALVNQLLKLGMTRLAVAYVDDTFGRTGLAAIRETLARQGVTEVAAVALPSSAATPAALAQAARTIAEAGAQGVCVMAVGDLVGEFIKAMRAAASGAQIYALSVVNPADVVRAVGPLSRGIGLSQVFPSPFSDANALAREFRAAMKAHAPSVELSYFALEGYVNARVLVEALRRAGPAPTGAAVRKALETAEPLDLGGFSIQFDPQTRAGSRYVDLTVIDGRGKLVR